MPDEAQLQIGTEFLKVAVQELQAIGGGIWLAESNQLVAIAADNLECLGLAEFESVRSLLTTGMSEALKAGRPLAIATSSLADVPRDRQVTLLLSPFRAGDKQGVTLIAQPPEMPSQQRDGQLQYLAQRGVELGQRLRAAALGPQAPAPHPPLVSLNGAEPQQPVSRPVDARALLGFIHQLQRSLDVNEVAGVAVNDGRLLFGVDRVSLVLRRGRKSVVAAVSGQESVHPRGNLIRRMRTLAGQVIAAGEPLRYDGAFGNLPPQLEQPLAEFIQESGARFLILVPLLEPERLIKPEETSPHAKPVREPRRSLGALVIEQMQSSEPSPQLLSTLDPAVDHIAAAVFNAKTHSAIFLLPLWRAIGRFVEWLRGRRLALAAAGLALLIAFSAALALVPWPYRVDATGRLMPVIQREVFAPWDGQVVELLVQGGERVEAGQVLLQLRSDELSAELVTVENQLHEKRKLVSTLIAQRDDVARQGNRDEELKLQAKAVETKDEVEGAAQQATVLKDRLARLTVRAPLAGVVTTFQAQQLLLNRPVKRGDLLLQVMDETGDWQLELEVAEHRLGRILVEQQRLAAVSRETKVERPEPEKSAANDPLSSPAPNPRPPTLNPPFQQLPIEYRLLTQSEASYFANLNSLATRTVTAESQGSVIEARATLDKTRLPVRAIGAEVRARIGCGTSCLGDVLFGDVIEFVQKYLWW